MNCSSPFRRPRSYLLPLFYLLLICVLAGCSNVKAPPSGPAGPGGPGLGALASITVSSPQPSIAVSQTDQFSAIAKDAHGNVLSGLTFTWSSGATGVATIDPNAGLALGLLPGTTPITASANGITSQPFTLSVTPGFRLTGSLNIARYSPTATMLNNGMVLIAGGNGTGTSSGILTSAEALQSRHEDVHRHW